jgi:hypothetical protein
LKRPCFSLFICWYDDDEDYVNTFYHVKATLDSWNKTKLFTLHNHFTHREAGYVMMETENRIIEIQTEDGRGCQKPPESWKRKELPRCFKASIAC